MAVKEIQGYTFSQMKESVLVEMHRPISQRNLAGLLRIFVPNISPLWSEEIVMKNLYQNMKNSTDPYEIEEAARILIDCSYWWDDQSEKYLEYGADNNGW